MKQISRWILSTLFFGSIGFAETRQELDSSYSLNPLLRQTAEFQGSSAASGGLGFRSSKGKSSDGGIFEKSVDSSMKFRNNLNVQFACFDSSNPITIPARFQKVAWRILGTRKPLPIEKGEGVTDGDGGLFLNVYSTKADLTEHEVAFLIGGQIIKIVAGRGPYAFDTLPYAACSRAKAN